MDPFDDNNISSPSDNFAYKDDREKDELQDQIFLEKMRLELKFKKMMLFSGVLLGAGFLIYAYFSS
ncbi:MAG TPA: hypothetical protein VGO47_04345 [Chlamydiales bacterium]|jgi:hypothetical protein|nr:hypothetical protein [Chlamydiales bacterium]